MALRKIVTLPEPVLRRKARPVTTFDKNLQTLIDDMIETMRDAPGVGLAAPQIGLSERLVVIEYAEDEEDEDSEQAQNERKTKPKRLFAVANPEIVKASNETLLGVEGCLSIPNLLGEVERHAEVHVKALNRHGQPMKIKAQGWLARIFQHEIDHLNGVLFTERATRLWQPQQDVDPEQEV